MKSDITARLTAVLSELARALGSLVKRQPEVSTAQTVPAEFWLATLKDEGDGGEVYVLGIDEQGAARVAALAAGKPVKEDDAAIPELLRKALAEVSRTLAARSGDERLELTLISLERTSGSAPAEDTLACAIGMEGLVEPLIVAAGLLERAEEGIADLVAERDGSRFDVILDIDLPVVVRFGHTELSIRALSRLGPGSVIDLGRSPDEPVEVLVSNRVVAHGEVVIVGGNYGVRILDVASRSERARSMEA